MTKKLEQGGDYGEGDYVTMGGAYVPDGGDIFICTELNYNPGDVGKFKCVQEPPIDDITGERFVTLGEEDWDLCSRYTKTDRRPKT